MIGDASLAAQVARAVARHHLFAPGARIDIALSAGPDSTALLAVLAELSGELDLELRTHHVRHGLRDDDHEDAAIAAGLAVRFGIPHLETHLTPLDLAGDQGPEANARQARYAALLGAARDRGASCVATGHHADDALETLLVRLVRGAGLEGLAGMAPRRPLGEGVALVRPLLDVPRERLLLYVAERGLPTALDVTNLQRSALRNRLRHDVIAALAASRPGALVAARRSVALLGTDARALAELSEAVVDQGHLTAEPAWYLPVATLAELGRAAAAQVLRHAARRVAPGHTPTAHTIERALAVLACWPELGSPPPGRRGAWRDDRVAIGRDGGYARVGALDASPPAVPPNAPLPLPPPPGIASNAHYEVHTWRSSGPRAPDELELAADSRLEEMAIVAAGSLEADATLTPSGMQGHKNVRRILAELGVPAPWRPHHPTLVDRQGRVLWIVGGPIDASIAPTQSTLDPTPRLQVRPLQGLRFTSS